MRKFKVICTQISGKGKNLFNYSQECNEDQIENIDRLLKDGSIVELNVKESKEESKKDDAKTESKEEVKADESKKESKEESKK